MTARFRPLPHGTACHPRLTVIAITFLLGGTLVIPTGWAQLLQLPVAIQKARILTMDGRVIENGTLVIRGDRIVALGEELEVPLLAKKMDVKGATITPGLIDVSSSLGMGGSSGGGATRRAEDAFNRYDKDHIKDALSCGVTAVYVSPGGSSGVLGTAAVMRLVRTGDNSFGQALKSDAALCVDLGSASQPIARLKIFSGVQRQFQDALKRRQALKDYEEELAEYTKKLKERAEKKSTEKTATEKTPAEGKPGGTRPSPQSKPSPSPKEKPVPPKTAAEDGDKEGAEEGGKEEDQKDAKKDEGEKKDELKKPKRPARDDSADLILRVLDREMPLRVRAERSGDILNALDLADEFSMDLILEGATESHLVADQIAEASVGVVLGRLDYGDVRKDDMLRRALREQVAILSQAGVSWSIGSGATGAASASYVALNAQLAAARSGSPALQLVTAAAADSLRVGDRIGRLRPGLLADFVVWSGDPLDPASKVLSVYVGGALVYEAAAETK